MQLSKQIYNIANKMKISTCEIYALLVSGRILAYETPTHAFITREAFNRSALGVNSIELYTRLGFDRLDLNQPFDTGFTENCAGAASTFESENAYADARPAWLDGGNMPPNSSNIFFRCPQDYERRDMPPEYSGRPTTILSMLGNTPQLRFEAWLMRGVIREDDVESKYFSGGAGPDIDPWGEKTRVFNHFYSPVTNSPGSNLVVLAGGKPALGWAVGEVDPFTESSIPDPTRGNHYTYIDARRAFFYAMTYKQRPTTADTAFVDSKVRLALWATTLKSLGHVIHLLQDQASPQHSRGEPHNHVCGNAFNQDIAT